MAFYLESDNFRDSDSWQVEGFQFHHLPALSLSATIDSEPHVLVTA